MTQVSMAQLAGLLDEAQAGQVEALLATLSPAQALWLSGYLAAIGQGAIGQGMAGGVGTAPATTDQAATGSAGRPSLTVLYATETGNAEGVARQLAGAAASKGIEATAVDMADYRPKNLRKESLLAVVAATHGEGDPPDPAAGFFEFLLGRKAPKLEDTKFAVLSLGDSSYVEFCKAGRDMDARLEELGAERILDRVDCDVDYDEPADAWIERLVATLEELAPPAEPAASPDAVVPRLAPAMAGVPGAPNGKPDYSRKNPYRAEILDAVVLSGRHSDKETIHLELSVEEDALLFEPGDSLGVMPENEDPVTETVLETLGFSGSEPVTVHGDEHPLADALRHELELTRLTPAFLTKYAEAAAAQELRDLLGEDRREELNEFMACNQVSDILRSYPVEGLEPQGFVDMLRKLQPRLYSIASSQKWLPDQIDLTIAVTRFTRDRKPRNGVASTYLAERREPGETVEVYIDRNKAFKLPEDPTAPVIMIGAGTGVAPFRAFLQERVETGATGRNWLFFGERRFREDFLYQTEWQRFLRDGVLTRMDVAFSRDRERKVYVQDRARERGRELWEWMEEGAYIYVCGDANGMAPGVDAALHDVVVQEGDYSRDDAGEYLRQLRHERRYQKDVY
jgi:sulfite reductase (NADPH) flavoprotein alpha-component